MWLAATIAGVAIGVVVGMLTAGFRARQAARQMASGGPNAVWDMSRYALVMGIFLLSWGTDPIFADPRGLWAWTYPLVAATAAGIMFGMVFVFRDERRLPIPPSTHYPSAQGHPPAAGHWRTPGSR